jgi:hypothetical protein
MLSTFNQGSVKNFGAQTERVNRCYVKEGVPKTK